MRKHSLAALAAAAAAAAATPAAAQSTVTLYGLIDVGVEYLDRANAAGDSLTRVIGAHMAGSRWGMRGTEDLGGGLNANFVIEGGFRPDTGVIEQGGRLFGRIGMVGLSGRLGAVTLGRQAIVLNDVMFAFDPMAFSLYSVATLDGKFFGRADNSIKYVAPSFGGLQLSTYYTTGLDTAFDAARGEVAGNDKIGRAYGLAARYAIGPVNLGFVYDRANAPTSAALVTTATGSDSDERYAVAANTKLGAATLFLGYRHLRQDRAAATDVKSNYAWAGLRYMITPSLQLTAAYYHNDIEKTDADPSLLVLNADYLLSKRTDVYMSVGRSMNRTDGATGSSVGVTAGGEAVSSGKPGADQTGLVVGIRHRF